MSDKEDAKRFWDTTRAVTATLITVALAWMGWMSVTLVELGNDLARTRTDLAVLTAKLENNADRLRECYTRTEALAVIDRMNRLEARVEKEHQ